MSRTERKVLRYAFRHGGTWYVRRHLPSARKVATGAVATGAAVVAALLIARRVRARSEETMPSSTSVRFDPGESAGTEPDLHPPLDTA